MRRAGLISLIVGLAAAAAPPALAEIRSGQIADPAGDGNQGRDIVAATASYDQAVGTLRADVRFAAPLPSDDNFKLGVRFASIGAAGVCGSGPSHGRLFMSTGTNTDVLVGGNPVNDFNDFSSYTGLRSFSPDRTSVSVSGSDARLVGFDLRCVQEVYLYDFTTQFTPDRTEPFPIAVAAPPAPPAPAPPAPPPPAGGDGIAPKILLPGTNRSITATRRGVVGFALGATAQPANGVLRIETASRVRRTRRARARVIALGTASFTTVAGRRVRVAITLSKADRRLLRAKRRLRARATIRLTDAQGDTAVRDYEFTLRFPRRS